MTNFRLGLPQDIQSTLLQDSRANALVYDAFLLGFIRAGNPYEPAGGASAGPGKGPSTPPGGPAGDREPRNPIPPYGLGGAEAPIPPQREKGRGPLPVRRTPKKEEVPSR